MRFALILLFVAAANAAQLRRVSEPIPGRYIVKIKSGTKVQSVLPSVRLAGGRVRSVYDTVLNGFCADLSREVLDVVLNLPSVEYVEEDAVVRAANVPWGLDRIDQRDLPLNNDYHYHAPESDVTVYVLDTGIRTSHNDFGGRATFGTSLIAGENDDGNGHGTTCAATVGGSTYGVARDAKLVAVKVLSNSGSGSVGNAIAGLQWAVDDAVHAVSATKVASLSFVSGTSTSLDAAVASAVNSNVVVVVAAGNNYDDACNYSPAREPLAVTVGSTDNTDTRASSSNYGGCVDIFAPGVDIVSAGRASDTDEVTYSGTSMAGAHAAGALALIRGFHHADLATEAVEELIHHGTPDKITNPGTGSPNLLLFVVDDHHHDDHDH